MYHGGINNSDYLITNPKSKHIFKGVRRRCDFSNAVFQKRQEWCRNNNDVSKRGLYQCFKTFAIISIDVMSDEQTSINKQTIECRYERAKQINLEIYSTDLPKILFT
jgi:hypothetical protein